MKKKFYAFTITMLFGLVALTTTLTAQVIRYVKAGGTGTGTSWANASGDLQAMINASAANDQVWVAKGTYKPTTTTDRTISFTLKEGVKIYGGFAGTETAFNQRTLSVIAANGSILSGDLSGNDIITGTGSTLSITNNAENSYHVFTNNAITVSAAAILDGFTITGGNANVGNSSVTTSYGGGLYLSNSSPTISNCSFTGNSASIGGGMYNLNSSPSLNNVTFLRNSATNGGGGMDVLDGAPSLVNVIFSGNNAVYGGGMSNEDVSFPSLINVTFSGNNATSGVGGMTSAYSSITNCIFWGNTNTKLGITTTSNIGGTPVITYSDIQGGFSGPGNLNIDPQFVNAATGDLRLQASSCAINTGSNAAVAGISTDFAGNPRIYNNGIVDMGAYEYQGTKSAFVPPATTTNNALNFDGTDDYVSLSITDYSACTTTPLNLTNALTIEYWFKGSNIQSAVRFQDANGYISAGWNGSTTNPYTHILSNDGGVANGIAVGAAATDGNWHHIAMTWQQGTANGFKSYLDGALVTQRDAANTQLPVISGLYLGSNAGTGEFTNGSLDEVRVWSVARSQADIQAGMCGGVTIPQIGLLMYYTFDHGAGNGSNAGINILANSANASQFTGTLQNFALTGTASNWVSPKIVPATRYVKQGGTGQGTSWADASGDLQAMINASCVSQVWVAKGTYKPSADATGNTTPANVRTKVFVMKEGIKIYGGFAGTETALSQRTLSVIAANPTILSGDLLGNDVITGAGSTLSIANNAENSYHVITNSGANLTAAAGLDGFTITGGNANAPSSNQPAQFGGGISLSNSSPTITNCIFSGNSAITGGGMCNNNSSPSLSNVSFTGNLGTLQGGGMLNTASSPSLINVIFSGNNAINFGGGMYNDNGSAPGLTNVTFSGNNAAVSGGGLNFITPSTIQNSIFWGNTAGGTIASNISNISGNTPANISYSDIQGGYAGTGNINQDPSFVNATNPAGADGIFGTADDGLALTACSPALNIGNNTGVASTDITGNPRIFNTTVDMGAYELQSAPIASPTRLYVNATATGANTGFTWTDAFTDLQAALNYTCKSNLTEIWVAKGTYKPTATKDRTISFVMTEGVKIYGGFAGTETALSQRSLSVIAANPSILTGDLNSDDVITGTGATLSITNNAENSYHVITNGVSGLTAAAVLDGFTITSGNANGASGAGGGISLSNSSPTITNCSFLGNSALTGGGGMYNISSSPSLSNVIFSRNVATGAGGGIYIATGSGPNFINVIFSGNNTAGNGGGMYYDNPASTSSLINVTFSGNNAVSDGGGIFSWDALNIQNSIFWGNTGGGKNSISGVPFSVTYSDIEGGYYNTGNIQVVTTGNIYVDPQFVNAATGDFRLQASSCAINDGNNTAVAGISTDFAGNPRIYNSGTVDMGAYEYQGAKQAYSPPAIATSTNNALNFDGTNDYISLSTVDYSACTNKAPVLTNALTIEYWFKGSNIQSAVRFQDANGYISAGWNGNTTNPYTHILSNDGGAANGIAVGAAATDGNWHHIAMTWQQGTANGFKSYLDGALVTQRDAANTQLPVISGLYLGSNAGTGEFTNGSLDEVRVWSVARSQADIQAGMCGGVTIPQTGLLMYYKFDHGAANGSNAGINMLLNSANASQFTGTLQNFALTGTSSNWVTAKALPAAPASGGNQVQCAQSPIQTLTAGATGGTIVWYDAASGGNIVASPTLSAIGTVTYYAQASDGTCSSLTRTAVTLTINTSQSAPVSGGNQVQCAQSPIQTLTAGATGGTIVWYDAASGGNIVASPTLSAIGTVTYYAQSSGGTCSSLTRTAITLTINTSQSAPVSGGNQVQCAQSPIQTLTAAATGGTIVWYDAASGGNIVASPTLSAIGTVTFYAQSSGGTCNSLTRTAVTLTINTSQSAPVSGGNQVQCAQSPIQTLTAAATGGTIVWYDAASGGNIVASPTLSAIGTVTFYAQSSGGTCSSLTRTAVTLTINPPPAAPVSGGDQTQSAQSPIQTLTATATSGAIVWYDAATSGNTVASPILNSVGTITYYAQSSNGTCISLTRTAVKLTINPPVLYTITASAGANGNISPTGSVGVASGTNKTFIITPNAGYAVQAVLVDNVSQGAIATYTFNNVTTAHAISASFVAANQPTASKGGSDVTITLPVSSVVLDGSASTGNIVQYYWFQAVGPISSVVTNNFSAVTTATGLTTPGTYIYVLQVIDNLGVHAYSQKVVTVNPGGIVTTPACVTNTSPSNASTLGTQTTATLTWPSSATATSYDVYLQTGTGTPTILVTNTAALNYSATGLTAGTTYSWYIAPRNASGAATTCATVNKTTFTTAAAGTQATISNGGGSVTITLPTSSVTLDGSGSTGNIVQYYWFQANGPVSSVVTNNFSAVTTATGLTTPGTYTYVLQVIDNLGVHAYSQKVVTVDPGVANPVPACVTNTSPVNGATLTTATTATLTWPSSATATSYDVYLQAGTGIPTILVANTAALTYSTSGLAGNTTYNWYIAPRNASGPATTCVTTNKTTFTTAAAANQPTASNGGPDVTITLPTSSVTLNGSASTGNIVQYYWFQANGPVSSVVTNNFSAITTASGLTTAGTYTYVLQVIDNNGVHAYSQKVVTVKAAGTRAMDPTAPATPSLTTNESSSLPSVTAVISPNPVMTGQQAKLQIISNKAGAVMVNIVSSNGAVIGTKKVNLVAGINNTTINTYGLAQGFYVIKLSGIDKPLNLKLVVE